MIKLTKKNVVVFFRVLCFKIPNINMIWLFFVLCVFVRRSLIVGYYRFQGWLIKTGVTNVGWMNLVYLWCFDGRIVDNNLPFIKSRKLLKFIYLVICVIFSQKIIFLRFQFFLQLLAPSFQFDRWATSIISIISHLYLLSRILITTTYTTTFTLSLSLFPTSQSFSFLPFESKLSSDAQYTTFLWDAAATFITL